MVQIIRCEQVLLSSIIIMLTTCDKSLHHWISVKPCVIGKSSMVRFNVIDCGIDCWLLDYNIFSNFSSFISSKLVQFVLLIKLITNYNTIMWHSYTNWYSDSNYEISNRMMMMLITLSTMFNFNFNFKRVTLQLISNTIFISGPPMKWLYPKLLINKYHINNKVLKRLYLNKTFSFIPFNISATTYCNFCIKIYNMPYTTTNIYNIKLYLARHNIQR